MGKKQRRMEQDPKIEIGGKPFNGKIKVDIDSPSLKKLNDDAAEAMRNMAKQMGAGFLFGDPPVNAKRAPGGGNISGDWVSDNFVKRFGVDSRGMFPLLEDRSKQTVSTMIFEKAVKVWENPIDWTFGVGYNAGQETYWFTARYHDDEGTMLVEETQEFTEQQLLGEQWASVAEGVEIALEKMHERCEAEIAMFEEDG